MRAQERRREDFLFLMIFIDGIDEKSPNFLFYYNVLPEQRLTLTERAESSMMMGIFFHSILKSKKHARRSGGASQATGGASDRRDHGPRLL
jgi:hypothetical protein